MEDGSIAHDAILYGRAMNDRRRIDQAGQKDAEASGNSTSTELTKGRYVGSTML